MYKKSILISLLLICLSCGSTKNTQPDSIQVKTIKDNEFDSTFDVVPDYLQNYSPIFDTIFDSRDSSYYQAVLIDSTWWMTEDLHYLPSKDIKVNDSLGAIIGVKEYPGIYYTNGKDICPEGWNIPTENDWKKLFNFSKIKYEIGDIRERVDHSDLVLHIYSAYEIRIKGHITPKLIKSKKSNGYNLLGLNLGYTGKIEIFRETNFDYCWYSSVGFYAFTKNEKTNMLYNFVLIKPGTTYSIISRQNSDAVKIRCIKPFKP